VIQVADLEIINEFDLTRSACFIPVSLTLRFVFSAPTLLFVLFLLNASNRGSGRLATWKKVG
jgi:hypothetical protein